MNTSKEICDDLTIAIIGPYDETSLKNIENYKKLCKHVLVFMWSDIEPEKVKEFSETFIDKKVSIHHVSSPSEKEKEKVRNITFHKYKNLLTQVKGIMLATSRCQTKYMIRTRSDESYSDLSPMIEMFSGLRNDIVTTNVVWRTVYNGRHKHIGDHTFISETKTIQNVYNRFYETAFSGIGIDDYACEEILFDIIKKYNKDIYAVPVEDLGEYTISVRQKKYNKENINEFYDLFGDIIRYI